MWDLIVSVPDHCLSFYFQNQLKDLTNVHTFFELDSRMTDKKFYWQLEI